MLVTLNGSDDEGHIYCAVPIRPPGANVYDNAALNFAAHGEATCGFWQPHEGETSEGQVNMLATTTGRRHVWRRQADSEQRRVRDLRTGACPRDRSALSV